MPYLNNKPVAARWRSSKQIAGVRAIAVAAYNASDDGAEAVISLKALSNLIEICDQAAHTERAHEHPDDRAPDQLDRPTRANRDEHVNKMRRVGQMKRFWVVQAKQDAPGAKGPLVLTKSLVKVCNLIADYPDLVRSDLAGRLGAIRPISSGWNRVPPDLADAVVEGLDRIKAHLAQTLPPVAATAKPVVKDLRSATQLLDYWHQKLRQPRNPDVNPGFSKASILKVQRLFESHRDVVDASAISFIRSLRDMKVSRYELRYSIADLIRDNIHRVYMHLKDQHLTGARDVLP